ncbi:MAG: SDR family oxidoreductase [bacterium]|nr:SDR family oxidoreductase [bacterium]
MSTVNSKRIYITGCGGMLGEAFHTHLKSYSNFFAGDIDINDTFLNYCDVRDLALLHRQITKYNPDIVCNLAAITDLEYCESHPDEAVNTNTIGALNVLSVCRDLNIPIVHISTAGVFDGNQHSYHELDIPNPINVYGRTKLDAERILQEYPKHYIFRAGWMMGGGPKKDKKFVNKFIKKVQAGATRIDVVDDKVGTPTYTYDLVNNIFKVIDSETYGLYHSVCSGSASRYDVAELILRELQFNHVSLNKIQTKDIVREFPVERPASERLLTNKLKELDLYTMRDWETCLKEYLYQWK